MTEINREWNQRVDALWADFDRYAPADFRTAMDALTAELTEDDPVRRYERASAFDATDHPDRAAAGYREALDPGLAGRRRREAVIQLASSLRNLGRADEGVALLRTETAEHCDDLDDAVAAFLALCLADAGREREAVSTAVAALAPHLVQYRRSVADYARLLTEGA